MKRHPDHALSRRERQIMEIIYARGSASASDVQDALPDAPGYSSVRTLLTLLEEKGHLTHTKDGRRFVYSPTVSHDKARRSAMARVLQTFFGGSVTEAVATLIDGRPDSLSEDEIARLREIVARAEEEGR